MIKGNEDYQQLSIGFKDTFNEINAVIAKPTITIEQVMYTLEFFCVCRL